MCIRDRFEAGNLATTLLILRATELLTPSSGIDTATRTALLLYAGHNVVASLVSIPAGKAADRWGYRIVLAVGFLVGLGAYLAFGITGGEIPTLGLAFAAAGITIGVIEPVEHGAVAEAAPDDVRGSAFGLLAAIQSVGNLAASGIAGLLWTLISPFAAFIFAASAMAVAAMAASPSPGCGEQPGLVIRGRATPKGIDGTSRTASIAYFDLFMMEYIRPELLILVRT